MGRTLVALACGLVFGAGLAISGMTDPARVLGFLDVAGAWDPTLLFVMGAGLAVTTVGTAWARREDGPWLGGRFAWPTRSDLDARLVGGAVLFGVGWGLVGLCPGPALASLVRGSTSVFVFVAAMFAAVLAHRIATRGAEGS
jgi:uncharacterized membrane protein YedE/YeeE